MSTAQKSRAGVETSDVTSIVTIRPVASRKDRRAFLDLPWRLYRDDPNWIPPLRIVQQELAGFRRHPFYEIAEAQTFVAWRNGEPCGRIAAIINHEHNRVYNEQRGFFGFFETVEDYDVAARLLDAAREWLANRNIDQVRGPANPSANYECGMLVEGFGTPPTFMMTYNPPYYPEFVERYGFVKAQDLYAYIGRRDELPKFEARLGPMALKAQDWCQATIRPMHHKRDLRTFVELYNRSFEQVWGSVPLTEHEMAEHVATLRRLLDPRLALVAEVDGRGVGAVIGLPDYNPCIKEIDGRLFPFGFVKLLSRRKQVKRIRVISINVLPEYQRWGLGLSLLRQLVPIALEMGCEDAEFSWICESNQHACASLEKTGVARPRTFRIYDLDGAAKPAV